MAKEFVSDMDYRRFTILYRRFTILYNPIFDRWMIFEYQNKFYLMHNQKTRYFPSQFRYKAAFVFRSVEEAKRNIDRFYNLNLYIDRNLEFIKQGDFKV